MLAVAVPSCNTPPFVAVTVIVNTWFVPTAFVAFCGEIWMYASTQALFAFPQNCVAGSQPAVTLSAVPVVRVTDPVAFVKLIFDVACTCVDPAVAEVIVTVHDAVAAPPV